MRKLFIIIGLILVVSSCKKDKDCIGNIESDIILDIHYNKISCTFENFTRYYKNEFEFKNDNSCNRQPIPIELGFEGIILAQGVKVPYVGPNGGDPGYSLDVSIKKDTCDKFIDFKFI